MYLKYIFGFILVQHTICQSSTNGKSYYFKIGKTGNEFRVNNRIYFLNHNITDYDYTHKRIDNTNKKTETQENLNNINSISLFDEEWDFDHESIAKTELPLFIHKIYEKITLETKTTTRVLFNMNRNNTNPIIKFNLESLKPNETVVDAEFYFFWSLENNSKIYRESVVLRLYQFEKHLSPTLNDSTLIENPDVHKLFNVIYISKAQKGWQIFKIKKPIDNWLNGEDNLGLLLTVSRYDDNKLISVFNDTNEGVYRSFALVTVENNESTTEKNRVTDVKVETSTSCEKKQWKVDFKKLHWDNFIIAPKEFEVYDCVGKCMKLENNNIPHVKLLYAYNKRGGCCVPIDYVPLPIMFYDYLGNIVIKNYKNTIVTKCGCR